MWNLKRDEWGSIVSPWRSKCAHQIHTQELIGWMSRAYISHEDQFQAFACGPRCLSWVSHWGKKEPERKNCSISESHESELWHTSVKQQRGLLHTHDQNSAVKNRQAKESWLITFQAGTFSALGASVFYWAESLRSVSGFQGQLKQSESWLVHRGLFNNQCNYVWSKSRSNFLSKCSHWTPCRLLIHRAEMELEPERLSTEEPMWPQQMVQSEHRLQKWSGVTVLSTTCFSARLSLLMWICNRCMRGKQNYYFNSSDRHSSVRQSWFGLDCLK